MATKYSASFDALIDTGRRQLDEMTGTTSSGRNAHTSDPSTNVRNSIMANAGRISSASRDSRSVSGGSKVPATNERPQKNSTNPGEVIDGTAGGIAFRLTARR